MCPFFLQHGVFTVSSVVESWQVALVSVRAARWHHLLKYQDVWLPYCLEKRSMVFIFMIKTYTEVLMYYVSQQ